MDFGMGWRLVGPSDDFFWGDFFGAVEFGEEIIAIGETPAVLGIFGGKLPSDDAFGGDGGDLVAVVVGAKERVGGGGEGDGGEEGGGENDNNAMMFFLTERVERLREAVAPDCGVILAHHTKKMNRKAVGEDPFQALSGASALRGFYTSGLLMHRPDEESSMRRLEIELRNGPALPTKLIDKENGRWIELNPMNERLVRQDIGAKHDAERDRKGDVILNLIAEQGTQGKMYTLMQFASKFENKGSLGGETSIRNRIHVLATKGHVKFVRGEEAERLGLPQGATKYGYLCVKDMVLQTDAEHVNSETGEVEPAVVKVVPTHFMCPQTGAVLPVENPDVWVDQEVD